MYKIMFQIFIIILPVTISLFLPFKDFAYGIFSFLNFDITRLDNTLNIIVSNNKISSIITGFAISTLICILIRKANKGKLFNTGDKYHNYPLWIYWLASKILGYERISLVRIPIYLQYKLILKDIFPNIVVDDNIEIKEQPIEIVELNMDIPSNELNLILIDTYEIADNEIPTNKIDLPTILIKSGNQTDSNRTLNPEFIKGIRRKTNEYHTVYETLNIFSTTNTNHNKLIINQCFKNASRTGFEDVLVFQSSREDHVFDKGYKVL